MTLELVANRPGKAGQVKKPPSTPQTLDVELKQRTISDLSLIAGVLRQRASAIAAQGAAMPADDVGRLLQEVSERIEIVGWLQQLLVDPKRQAFDLGDYLNDIAAAVVASLPNGRSTILSHRSTPGCVVTPGQAISIGLIVAELIVNAVRYAHPSGVRGKLSVGCRRGVDGKLVVEVADDGVGLPEGFDPITQGELGLHIVRSLAGQLGATLEMSHDLGLCVQLVLPTRPALRRA